MSFKTKAEGSSPSVGFSSYLERIKEQLKSENLRRTVLDPDELFSPGVGLNFIQKVLEMVHEKTPVNSKRTPNSGRFTFSEA